MGWPEAKYSQLARRRCPHKFRGRLKARGRKSRSAWRWMAAMLQKLMIMIDHRPTDPLSKSSDANGQCRCAAYPLGAP